MSATHKKLGITLLLLLLVGCSNMRPYEFVKDEPKAELHNYGYGWVSMCKDNSYYSVHTKKDDNTIAIIPAGKRITFMKNMYFSGYNVSHSCYPKLSFVPKTGEKYIFNGGISVKGCYAELVKLDEAKETGVSVEPSVSYPNCYQKD